MLKLTLRQMEVLVAIADLGSFAAAADQFGIAQPSVSAHVGAVEREIGGLVFERRRGRRPALTDLGRSVVAHAREMLAEAVDLHADILNFRHSDGPRVVFSCQRSLANFVLKRHIMDFALSHPDIQLVVRIGKQEDVIAEVRDGIAEVGCFLGNDEHRGLQSEVIGRQRLLLVAGADHPLAGRRRIRPKDVERYGFVGPPPSSQFGRAVTKLLAGIGIVDLKVVAQATEYQFLRELVAAGVGISCSPEKSVEADVARGLLVALDLAAPELVFDIRQIVSTRRPPSPSAQALTSYLRQANADATPDPQGIESRPGRLASPAHGLSR